MFLVSVVRAVWGRCVEDLCKMVAALFTAITLSMLDVIIHATPNLHAPTLSNDCCFCLQMKTSVFCNLYRYFLSDYFAAAAEMSFPPIPSNLVHKGVSVKWAKISKRPGLRNSLFFSEFPTKGPERFQASCISLWMDRSRFCCGSSQLFISMHHASTIHQWWCLENSDSIYH